MDSTEGSRRLRSEDFEKYRRFLTPGAASDAGLGSSQPGAPGASPASGEAAQPNALSEGFGKITKALLDLGEKIKRQKAVLKAVAEAGALARAELGESGGEQIDKAEIAIIAPPADATAAPQSIRRYPAKWYNRATARPAGLAIRMDARPRWRCCHAGP